MLVLLELFLFCLSAGWWFCHWEISANSGCSSLPPVLKWKSGPNFLRFVSLWSWPVIFLGEGGRGEVLLCWYMNSLLALHSAYNLGCDLVPRYMIIITTLCWIFVRNASEIRDVLTVLWSTELNKWGIQRVMQQDILQECLYQPLCIHPNLFMWVCACCC